MKKKKKNKRSVLRGRIFPTQKEIKKFMDIEPSEILKDVVIEMPTNAEIEDFLEEKKRKK